MTIPVRQMLACSDPRWSIQVTDDGSYTLVDRASGDSMHSGCGAVTETKHVYLHNSGVLARLEQRRPTRVLEVGLGSGLGCLLTAAAANRAQTVVEYFAIENALTPDQVIHQLNFERHGIDASWIGDYCQVLREPPVDQKVSGSVGDFCRVVICLCDAAKWSSDSNETFDAIYYDPFSPATNPSLWSECVLANMHRLLKPDGRLVTYCVSRRVRDTLTAVGFQVDRVAGPVGGKRQVLIASVS